VTGQAAKNYLGATRGGRKAPHTSETVLPDRSTIPPYLSTEQLTALTPWSVDAIQKLIARGVLVCGVHFFQPGGRRSQRIFKWDKIVELIEGRADTSQSQSMVNGIHANGNVDPKTTRAIDVEKATTELRRLLD
jgi:hypothetical protein